MTTPIRAAIVGAGLMGRWHAHSIRRVGAQVVGVADMNHEAALALAVRYSGANAYTDIQEMLRQTRPDVLHVCTPLATHYDMTTMALEANVHALVEKPLVASAQETERLYEQAATKGLLICPVHQFVFQDSVQKALEWLPAIGEIVLLQGTFRSAGGRGLSGSQLDEIVADILPHPFSLLQVFLRRDVADMGWKTIRAQPGELHALSCTGGSTVMISISMNARPTLTTFEVVGATGTIHLDLFHGYAFREPGNVSRARKIVHPFDRAARQFTAAAVNLAGRALRQEPAYPGLRRLIGLFYHAIQGDSPLPLTPEKVIEIARVREKLSVASESTSAL